MNILNPIYIIILLLSCFLFSIKMQKVIKLPNTSNRYSSIDGLRGYAAFFVYIHHSSIWFFYLKENVWRIPPSHLYTHLGQTSVALFFMITGFLFYKKITSTEHVDWLKLFISRVLRLSPLYIFSISILIIISFCISGWRLNESISKITFELIRWYSFAILGGPKINSVEDTSIIVAGVVWSLKYEWLLYFSLPLLAAILTRRVPVPYLVTSIASILTFTLIHTLHPNNYPIFQLLFFVSGFIAAIISKNKKLVNSLKNKIFGLIAIICLLITVTLTPSAYSFKSLTLLTIFFCIICCENNLFGILTTKFSRYLGEISYSIYLTHGILLFITFYFLVGYKTVGSLTPIQYWMLIVSIIPILLLSSTLSYKYIELPILNKTSCLTNYLRNIKRNILQVNITKT